MVKKPPAMQETRVWFPGQENSLEKETATHSSILAWRIPWTEEAGGLQCMGSQTVEHDFTAKQQQTKLTSSSSDTDSEPHLWVSKSNLASESSGMLVKLAFCRDPSQMF